MRKLSEMEVLSLREILQLETNSLQKAKIMQGASKDKHIQELLTNSITTAEGRIRGIQQFISENDVLQPGEVR